MAHRPSGFARSGSRWKTSPSYSRRSSTRRRSTTGRAAKLSLSSRSRAGLSRGRIGHRTPWRWRTSSGWSRSASSNPRSRGDSRFSSTLRWAVRRTSPGSSSSRGSSSPVGGDGVRRRRTSANTSRTRLSCRSRNPHSTRSPSPGSSARPAARASPVGILTGRPLVIIVVPAGIIVCGAAQGIAQGLRIGLRAKVLALMGVEDPERPPPGPPGSPS